MTDAFTFEIILPLAVAAAGTAIALGTAIATGRIRRPAPASNGRSEVPNAVQRDMDQPRSPGGTAPSLKDMPLGPTLREIAQSGAIRTASRAGPSASDPPPSPMTILARAEEAWIALMFATDDLANPEVRTRAVRDARTALDELTKLVPPEHSFAYRSVELHRRLRSQLEWGLRHISLRQRETGETQEARMSGPPRPA